MTVDSGHPSQFAPRDCGCRSLVLVSLLLMSLVGQEEGKLVWGDGGIGSLGCPSHSVCVSSFKFLEEGA